MMDDELDPETGFPVEGDVEAEEDDEDELDPEDELEEEDEEASDI